MNLFQKLVVCRWVSCEQPTHPGLVFLVHCSFACYLLSVLRFDRRSVETVLPIRDVELLKESIEWSDVRPGLHSLKADVGWSYSINSRNRDGTE